MKESLNILVITTMPFPSGAASVNRIISYSKGLVELGTKITVLSTNIGNLDYDFIDGIKFKSLQTKYKKTRYRTLNFIVSLMRLLYNTVSIKEKFNSIILVSNSLALIYPLFILCKIFGIKFIQEKSEYPFVLKNKSILGKSYAKFYVSTTYKLFDGLIIMTNPLYEYLERKVRNNCKLIIVPMTVDVSRFASIPESNELGDYIAYCGDVGGDKDGVKNLIHAFSMIEHKYPTLRLLLIGGTKNVEELNQLMQYNKSLKTHNICFYGNVDRNKIPALLVNSKILALARPSSLQSKGGFPTKLGEYLSTGKPVVVTKVGDIPLYLKDQKNAFLVEPDDNLEFANKMSYILDNYDLGLEVAKEGKKLTETIFNYKIQAMRIQNFLYSL